MKKILIILTVFIDVLGIGIIIPVLPFYVKSFGASAMTLTLLFTVFSFFSFFSAPFLGALSDKVGRKPVLTISLFSTSLGWIIFAMAPNIFWLFIGRIIDGLAAGNFPIAQNYLIDIAKNEKEKTTNLGLIGATFGVGLIIGPLLGGFLSAISLSLPFWCVGILALINTILVIIKLPETNKNKQKDKKIEINPIKPIIRSLKNHDIRPGFLAWFLFGLALGSEQSIFSLYLTEQFNFSSVIVGFFMTGTGIILIFNQAFALKHLWLKYFKEEHLAKWFMFTIAIGLALMGIKNMLILIAGVVIMSFCQSILRVVITSQISKKSESNKQGETLGTLNSIFSLAMIIGPILAGYLFNIKNNLTFFVSAIFLFLAFIIILLDHKNKAKIINLEQENILIEQQKNELIS